MRLFELFDQDKATVSTIGVLIRQLEKDIDKGPEKGGIDPANYTVDELLNYFQMYDIILDVNDLYNMIKMPPLKGLIKNIEGDKVIFAGHSEEDALDAPDDKQDEIVAKMAKSAMK